MEQKFETALKNFHSSLETLLNEQLHLSDEIRQLLTELSSLVDNSRDEFPEDFLLASLVSVNKRLVKIRNSLKRKKAPAATEIEMLQKILADLQSIAARSASRGGLRASDLIMTSKAREFWISAFGEEADTSWNNWEEKYSDSFGGATFTDDELSILKPLLGKEIEYVTAMQYNIVYAYIS